MEESSLQRVIERVIVPVYLAQHYSTFYVRERLECGHTLIAYPQGDPLTARKRVCPDCARTGALPQKKPARSERVNRRPRSVVEGDAA